MTIDSIKNGYVIDHIPAGKGMELYKLLKLEQLACPVAIIKNAASGKLGKKDIIKIDGDFSVDLSVLGYIDKGITVNIIRNEQLVEKVRPDLPERMVGVLRCKNPRCITATEQELPHVFRLTDREKGVYRCLYCEAKSR